MLRCGEICVTFPLPKKSAKQDFEGVGFIYITSPVQKPPVKIFSDKMKIGLVFIVILSYVAFEKVSGRKCYFCASTDSFGKCDESRKEVDCSSILPGQSDVSCLKYSLKNQVTGISLYAKTCYPTSTCEQASTICNEVALDCKTYCCNSDLCNKGAGVPLISGVLLLTSVILVLFGI